MALTKVTGDFIKAGSITQGHLHSSHGITTSHIAEGDKLFFTNARVASYLSSNNYVSGTGTNNRLAIWNGTGVIDSDSDFYVDGDTIFTTNFQASGNISITGTTFLDGDVTIGDTNSAFIGMARAGANYLAATNSSGQLVFRTGGSTAALTLDASQNATFAGDITISGGDIILGGTGRIQGIDTVSANTDAANKLYVDNQVAGIVDSAPGTLNTLNELAAALGDDANFSATVTNSIGLKAPLASPSFTGNATFAGGISVSSPGSSFYTTFKSANDYVIGLKDSANTTQWWLKAFTNGSFALHEDSVGDKFTIAAGGNATFGGDVTAPSFIGKLMGGANGAPDATIWCVSGSYTDWGIFYDENTPDVIQFKSSGNVKATISLDHGDYTGRNATFTGYVKAPFFTSDGGRGFKQDGVAFVSTYSNGNDANAVNDIGSTSNKWRDAYFSGQLNSATISTTSNVIAPSVFTQNLYITSSGTNATNRIDNDGNQLYITYGGASNRALEISNANGNATFAGKVICNNVGNDRKIEFNRTGANVYSIEHDSAFLYFYNVTTNSIPLKLANNNNATFGGDVIINGSHLTLANGTTSAQSTDYLYIGGSGLASADAAIYIGNQGAGGGYGYRIYYSGTGSGNNNKLILKSENVGSEVDMLTFTADGNATFSGSISSGEITSTVTSGSNIELRKGDGYGSISFGGTAHQTSILEGVDGGGLKLYTAGNDVAWGGAWTVNTTWSGTNMTVAGTITASGGNSTQWNTAYGWGNHASAGYLTSLPSHNHAASAITSGNLAAARNTANLVNIGSTSDASGIYFRSVNEIISGEGWCTAQYAYNYNDGFLFLNRNSSNTAFPTFHIGGWNNAGYAGYADADGMITLTRSDGAKSQGSTYAGTGLSNTSYWTRMVKTAYKTIFKDAQDEHLFDGNVAIGIQTSGILTPEYGNLRVSNNGNGETTMGNGSIALQLGPATQRAGTSKPYYGGIAFNGLMNYNNSNTYDSAPHVWVGAKYHDTPGSERSYFAVGVKSGIGLTTSDVPVERFTIDYSGNAVVTGSSRAPIFYDSNNTNYYIHPGDTTSARLRGFVKIGNSSTYNTDDGTWGTRLIVASTIHARIDCAQDANAVRASWYTHTGQLYSTFGTVTGHDMRLISHNTVRQYLYNGWSQEASSYRAPLFYDSNDTGYYTNPNGVSRMAAIMTGKASNDSNGIASISLNDGQLLFRTNTDYNHKMWYYDGINFSTNPSHGHIRFWADSSSRNNSNGGSTIVLDSDCQHVITKIYGSTQSPIYYDINNTSYYVDPASTSNLNAATFVGTVSGQNAYFAQDVAIGFTSGNIGGNLNVKNSAAGQIAAKLQLGSSVNSSSTGVFVNTTASYASSGMFLHFQSNHISGDDNVLICYLDGDIVNKNNSYTQYSDEKLKENIVDATDKLEEVKQIKVRNFNFKGEDLKQIGVVAQELESIFPALVKEREVPGYEEPIKTVKYSVLVPILIKAMQEQQTIIDDLKSRVETLENQ